MLPATATRAFCLLGILVLAQSFSIEPAYVEWGPCPFSTHAEYDKLVSSRHPAGAGDLMTGDRRSSSSDLLRLLLSTNGPFNLQCTNITVPLDWSGFASGYLNIWVTRISPVSAKPTQHMWLVPGGPGESGEALLGVFNTWTFDLMDFFNNNMALLLWDHRGTGLSSFLTCSRPTSSPSYFADCAADLQQKWGGVQGLASFSTTNAALDLDYLIESISVKEVGEKNYVVYGGSYGTYLVQRWMDVRTRDPKAVITDGNIAADLPELIWMERTRDFVGTSLLSFCAQDTICSALFAGETPMMRLQDIYTAIDDGKQTCMNQIASARMPYKPALQNFLATLIENHYSRMLVPVIIFRLSRCNDKDIIALNHTFGLVPQRDAASDGIQDLSTFLWANIFTSELTQTNPSAPVPVEYLARLDQKLLFTRHSYQQLQPVWQQWPRYAVDKFFAKLPDMGTVPWLIIQGTMDTRTSFAWGTRLFAGLLNQQKSKQMNTTTVSFLKMPGCAHVAMLNSPMAGTTVPCGLMIARSYMQNPAAVPDTSCISQIIPYDWPMVTPTSQSICNMAFGTPNCYEY